MLEGLEVVFIALTFGSNQHDVPLACLAAVTAVVLVAGVGFAVRAPLARVPENSMKFVVGIMLTSFGAFWGAEGAGVRWPGNDASLPAVVAAVAGLCAGPGAGVPPGRAGRGHRAGRTPADRRAVVIARLRAFAAFWYVFVGDDWRVAVGVVAALAGTYALAHHGHPGVWWLVLAAPAVLLPYGLWRATRGPR